MFRNGQQRTRNFLKCGSSLPVLFLCLSLSSLARAQAGVTLVVKTDESCSWKLDGQSMGVLTADSPRVVLVSSGEHLIEASATAGIATTRAKVEVEKIEQTVDIRLKGQSRAAKVRRARTPHMPLDADAEKKEIWTDPGSGLMWTQKDNGSDVDWSQATDFCFNLRLAGYDDWRLPTNEELQGIHDTSVNARKVIDGVTYTERVKGNLKLTGLWEWSSTQVDGSGRGWLAWFFSFVDPNNNIGVIYPGKNFLHFANNARALCVHPAAE